MTNIHPNNHVGASYTLFITCPAGLESLLKDELSTLGVEDIRETVTGVQCDVESLSLVYTISLWSRFANRVILLLAQGASSDSDGLYRLVNDIDWPAHFDENATLKVDFSGTNTHIRHTQFGARLVKDGIVDCFQDRCLARPNVDLESPDVRINVRLTKKHTYVGLDLSGNSLHMRGYRCGGGQAPIKENLAAALLHRAGWPQLLAHNHSEARLVDPMCGSGTFLIEAALMQLHIAPGLYRQHFGFQNWRQHDPSVWKSVYMDAERLRDKAVSSVPQTKNIIGCELSVTTYHQCLKNIESAGLSAHIHVYNASIENTSIKTVPRETTKQVAVQTEKASTSMPAGIVLCNPPYGMRLGEADKLSVDYRTLAQTCKKRFPGWRLGILSSNPELLQETTLRAEKKYRIFNGAIPCELRLYQLNTLEQAKVPKKAHTIPSKDSLSPGALMVANRIQKNLKKLSPWCKKNSIQCYRIYDADLPEYAAAIDLYGKRIHIQEYQAPKTIAEHSAQLRFRDFIDAVQCVFQVTKSELSIKTRRINRGSEQYEKLRDVNETDFFPVHEGRASLAINLVSFLDTGLFLDHRPLRLRIANEVAGKRFLNLFCYTATATVHAVLGGAKESVSVDMSNTYLDWAQRNFDLNTIRSNKHQLIREDVVAWLKNARQGFDVIMLDPPSFSNSKKMQSNFDIQRDHSELVERCMELLLPGGCLYFSNNLRKFKLDSKLEEKYHIENITKATIDKDFERNPRIHHCFKIHHITHSIKK